MQINNIHNTPKQIYFNGNIKAKRVVDVAQDMAVVSLDDYKNYFIPLKYKVAMNAKELKQLYKINANSPKFLDACYKYYLTLFDIPNEIAPARGSINVDAPILFAYDFSTNTIVNNLALCHTKLTQNEIITYLRHEFQHYLQNMEIYRHETLGKEWLQFNIDTFIKNDKKDLKDFLLTKPIDEWGSDMNTLRFYYLMRECLRNNDEDTFNRLYKPYEDNITQSLTAFRERIIKAKGIIPKNSSSTEKIKGYMQGFKKSLNYSHNAENLKTCGYRTNPIEEEAYAVQLDLLEDLELMI